MMRIKEAIQRKKMIHEMNEEWKDLDLDIAPNLAVPQQSTAPSPTNRNYSTSNRAVNCENEEHEQRLNNFVVYLSGKLTDLQKRALKVTWKRLSEAPKTSGRGTLHIMEKVLTKLCEQSPGVTSVFYRSAFLSCIEDRKCGRIKQSSIATIRDHAHILITLIDDILHIMFEGPLNVVKYDPETIGEAHSRLGPLGFDKSIWHVFGECFAEVMFMQECIRAYPHAPSAWSLLSVALTDKIFSATKIASKPISRSESHVQEQYHVDHPPPIPERKMGMKCPFITANHKRSLPQIRPTCFSMDMSDIPTNNEDDEIFWTARSHFETTSCQIHPPPVPQRKLPTLTASMCDERMFENPRTFEDEVEPPPIRCRTISSKKFLRSKSEARIRVKNGIPRNQQSTDV